MQLYRKSGALTVLAGQVAAKYLDQALRYTLGYDGVWNTTADDIAEYDIATHCNTYVAHMQQEKNGVA